MKYETRITRLTVGMEGKQIYDPASTDIELDDEGAGEFLVLTQHPDDKDGEQRLRFDPKEWDAVVEAVEQLKKEIR